MTLANMNTQHCSDDSDPPSSIFHGRHLRVPGLPTLNTSIDLSKARDWREEIRQKSLDRIPGIKTHSPIPVGTEVLLKDISKGTYRERGNIVEQKKDGVSYVVKTPHGNKICNSKYLRLVPSEHLSPDATSASVHKCSIKVSGLGYGEQNSYGVGIGCRPRPPMSSLGSSSASGARNVAGSALRRSTMKGSHRNDYSARGWKITRQRKVGFRGLTDNSVIDEQGQQQPGGQEKLHIRNTKPWAGCQDT